MIGGPSERAMGPTNLENLANTGEPLEKLWLLPSVGETKL